MTVHTAAIAGMILWVFTVCPAHLCGKAVGYIAVFSSISLYFASVTGTHRHGVWWTPPNWIFVLRCRQKDIICPRRSRWLQNNRENPWSWSLCRQKSRSNVTLEWRTCLIRTSNSFKPLIRLIVGIYGIWKPRASPSVSKFHKHLLWGV